VYRPNVYVAPSGQPPGYRMIPISASHPKMASAWHVFDPAVMYWAPRSEAQCPSGSGRPRQNAVI
jgi:beta-glucosidase